MGWLGAKRLVVGVLLKSRKQALPVYLVLEGLLQKTDLTPLFFGLALRIYYCVYVILIKLMGFWAEQL